MLLRLPLGILRTHLFHRLCRPPLAHPFLPLPYLAVSLGLIADAYQACTRLQDIFTAELLEESATVGDGFPAVGTNGSRTVDASLDVAIRVKAGQFTWDGAPPAAPEAAAPGAKKASAGNATVEQKAAQEAKEAEEKRAEEANSEERIFKLKDIDLEIPKGKVGIVIIVWGVFPAYPESLSTF